MPALLGKVHSLLNSDAASITTLPLLPLLSNTNPPRCEKAINTVGLLAVLLPLTVIVQGAYGVLELSVKVQLAPGATFEHVE